MENQEVFFRNNTGIKSKSAIIDGFVIRISEFDEIMKNLKDAQTVAELQNIIVFGQRGAGKTTLLHRVRYGVVDSNALTIKYLPIIFSEEQYNLSDLTNLWEAVAVVIDDEYDANNLSKKIEFLIDNEKDFEKKSLECLVNYLNHQDKIAIIFLENINFFLGKLTDNERMRFVAILTDSNIPIRIIGSSTTYNDGNIDFGNSLFKAFQKIQLDGLSQEDCEKMLISIGKQFGEEKQIKNVIINHPGRVESLRRLTGGVPRTISYLFQIFLDNENGKAIKDLYLLIDNLSLLYKSELDRLSTQQQKVIDAIARKWDAISVKDIVKKTRLESKNVSTILAYLEKNQFVEKVPTNTKNNLYRIRERFMNIWYLMRFGRKHDQANVIWLVRFFDAWCDESELTKKAKNYMDNLKDGNYEESVAIDMGNTFLSCENIPASLKEEILKTRNSVLPGRLLKQNPSGKDILKKIKNIVNEGRPHDAISLLEKIDDRNVSYYRFATSVYLSVNDKEKALESVIAAKALEKDNPYIAVTLGYIYEAYFKDIGKAVKAYEECLQLTHPHPYAANRLGDIAYHNKDYEKALQYHKLAAAKHFKASIQAIPRVFLQMGEFDKAENYIREFSTSIKGANSLLFDLLIRRGKEKEAKMALKMAVKEKEEGSNYLLGRYYLTQKRPNLQKAEEQFENAVKEGSVNGYLGLARIAARRNEIDKAISLFHIALDKHSAEAAHQLGHIYNSREEFEKSDEMFAKAMQLGHGTALGCWIDATYKAHRNDKKEFLIELIDKHRNSTKIDTLRYDLLYAKALLWNDRLYDSLVTLGKHASEFVDLEASKENGNEKFVQGVLSDVVDYFLLLLAKREYKSLIDLFENNKIFDYKVMLRPIYYLLMSEMKDEYPSEYLKAGKELTETINDLKKEVDYIRKRL